jgi:DoxX-like family
LAGTGFYDAPMFLACVVVTVLLALVAFGSALGKLQGVGRVRELIEHVGMIGWLRPLGYLELAAAIGLIVGLFWAPIGIAAAGGLILYYLGAIIAHVRVHDGPQQVVAPVVPLLLAVAALVLRLATM